MAIRIIAGEFGGRTIRTPDGFKTHPMGERERGAIFNSLVDDLLGAKVLDAFAGSGALGIEALSRGAARADFAEKDRKANEILYKNIADLQIKNRASLHGVPLNVFLDMASEKYDIIFADPPYDAPQWAAVTRLFDVLTDGGILVVSHRKGSLLPEMELELLSSKTYAEAQIDMLRKI